MNTFAKISLLATVLVSTLTAQAKGAHGSHSSSGSYAAPHYRASSGTTGGSSYSTGSGYVYRNPYAATPSVRVREYTRESGTTVLPHYRTPANDTVTDNLNYRGYGTVREPRFLNGLK